MEILYETTAKKSPKNKLQNTNLNLSLTEFDQEDLICSFYSEPMDHLALIFDPIRDRIGEWGSGKVYKC